MRTTRGMKWIRRIGLGVLGLVAVYLVVALGLTAWPGPGFTTPVDDSPEALRALGLSFEQVYPFEEVHFRAPDDERLFARHFPVEDPSSTVLLLHGMAGESRAFNRTSGLLREATGAEVYALDLRGHGQSGGRPGDVDHVDQYVEDVVAVVSTIRAERPGGKLILAAHSMGGGIAARYAMLPDAPAVDGYVLYAPSLGRDSPTNRSDPPPPGVEPWLKVDQPRLIGLVMLNAIGVKALNGLPIVFLHVAEDDRVHSYSFRAMASAGPAAYAEGLAAFEAPLLLLVGSEDEAFHAERYAPLVEEHAHVTTQVVVVAGANHNGVHHDAEAVDLVAEWVSRL